MFCSKCGCMNSVTTKNCLNCGQPLDRTTRIKKHKRRQRLNFFVVAILFLGTGFGSAKITQRPTKKQPETEVEKQTDTQPYTHPPLEQTVTASIPPPLHTYASTDDGTHPQTD